MQVETKRGPGRPRKEPVDPISPEMRARRKKLLEDRRNGGIGHRNMKLAVNEGALDRENFEYRWVNDDPMRVNALTQNDVWETVAGTDYRPDTEGTVSVMTGRGENGQPVQGYLMRKPKAYFEEDKAAKREAIERKNRRIERAEDDAAVERSYAPSGGIAISRE